MAIFNLTTPTVVPTDVFGYEVNTDVGYGRETFLIKGATVQKPVKVGSILAIDEGSMTASFPNVNDLRGKLGVFVGRDLPTNPATSQDFERLTMTADGKGVLIIKGDGSSILKRGYLDVDGVQYYKLHSEQRSDIDTILINSNRFKMVDQQYTPTV